MIVLEWSWFSFFVGMFAMVSLGFWGLVALAIANYRKQNKQKEKVVDATAELFKNWGSGSRD